MHNFSDYFLLTERIGWRLTDFDFDAIDLGNVSDLDRQKARDTAVTESGVPHYASTWGAVQGINDHWELRQFAALWAGEEHRHSEGLRLLCEKLGVDLNAELWAVSACDFVGDHNRACASGCYNTVSGLLTYTVIQELITWKFYVNWAKSTESTFIRELCRKIAADEIRHHQWFANALQRYLGQAADPRAYREAIADAVASFSMPHRYYPVQFPYFDAPDSKYFTPDDYEGLKAKVVKVLTFDEELTLMLLQRGEETLSGHFADASAAE